MALGDAHSLSLWQGFSVFGERTDTVFVYEPNCLKMIMQLSSKKDRIRMSVDDRRISTEVTFSENESSLGGFYESREVEQLTRTFLIPFQLKKNEAVVEERDNVLTMVVPWASAAGGVQAWDC